jgi:hypothetical protein
MNLIFCAFVKILDDSIMSDMNPILNSPYEAPQLHYATSHDGSLDYGDIRHGRRIFTPDRERNVLYSRSTI